MRKTRRDRPAGRVLSAMSLGLLSFARSSHAAQPPAPRSVPEQQSPPGMFVPPLHPGGTTLAAQELTAGVYALVSSKVPVDNSGFVVGENGVLVIDAHINGAMARQIQEAVRRVTPKPIL